MDIPFDLESFKRREEYKGKSGIKKDNWIKENWGSPILALYEEHIEKYFQPSEGGRNEFVVLASTRLVDKVAKPVAMELIKAFYVINDHYFNDSLEQHMKEAESHFDAVRNTYHTVNFNTLEKQVYDLLLDETKKDAFRILWSLAKNQSRADMPRGQFFIPCEQFGDRLGKNPMAAYRLLKEWEDESAPIIKLRQKGQTFQKGRHAMASVYVWNLRKAEEFPLDSETSGKAA